MKSQNCWITQTTFCLLWPWAFASILMRENKIKQYNFSFICKHFSTRKIEANWREFRQRRMIKGLRGLTFEQRLKEENNNNVHFHTSFHFKAKQTLRTISCCPRKLCKTSKRSKPSGLNCGSPQTSTPGVSIPLWSITHLQRLQGNISPCSNTLFAGRGRCSCTSRSGTMPWCARNEAGATHSYKLPPLFKILAGVT